MTTIEISELGMSKIWVRPDGIGRFLKAWARGNLLVYSTDSETVYSVRFARPHALSDQWTLWIEPW